MLLNFKAMHNILLIGNLTPANKPLFADAEAYFKSRGHSVSNPARVYTLAMNDRIYFTRRYIESLTAVTAVCFLPDYRSLPFADVLVTVANSLALPVISIPVLENETISNKLTNF